MNRLTVIIPGYNTPEALWRRCISSVMKAEPKAEIICVDDGSADGATFLDEIEGIRVVHQKNTGVSGARNRALGMAKGEWVSFVDSDDEVRPEMFDKCIMFAEETKCDVCICGVEVLWESDGLKKRDVLQTECYGELDPVRVKQLAESCLLNYAWNKVFRRRFLQEHRIEFPVGVATGEDLIFNFDCILSGAKWCNVDCIGYVYHHTRMSALARYVPNLIPALRHCSQKWVEYKTLRSEAKAVLGNMGERTEASLVRSQWKNIWMPKSPYDLKSRREWYVEHLDALGHLAFIKMIAFVLFRRYFYFRPLRRINVKRHHSNAVNI